MEDDILPPNYITAEGLDGLAAVLETLLHEAQIDPKFAAQEHYILYRLNQQRALITVDLSQHPYQFWYNDLHHRPATKGVKNVIAKFLWEKCGVKEAYLKEVAEGK